MSRKKKQAGPDYSLECPFCGSREVRYLRKTNSVYCRRCGGEWSATWIDPPKGKGVK